MGSLKIFFLLDALAMGCEFCRKGNAFFVKYDALGLQASTGMSSQGRLVGKGKGSIAVEAVMLRLLYFAPPSIDSMPSHMPSQE